MDELHSAGAPRERAHEVFRECGDLTATGVLGAGLIQGHERALPGPTGGDAENERLSLRRIVEVLEKPDVQRLFRRPQDLAPPPVEPMPAHPLAARWGVANHRSSNGIGESIALCGLKGQSRGCKSTRLSEPHRLISQVHGKRCGEPFIVPSKPDSGPKRAPSEEGWKTKASKSSRPPMQTPGATTSNPGRQPLRAIPGQQSIPCSVGERRRRRRW